MFDYRTVKRATYDREISHGADFEGARRTGKQRSSFSKACYNKESIEHA